MTALIVAVLLVRSTSGAALEEVDLSGFRRFSSLQSALRSI